MRREWEADLGLDGYVLLRGLLGADEAARLRTGLAAALDREDVRAMRTSDGAVYGARNIVDVFPPVVELARAAPLAGAVAAVLGSGCGLIRALYFDKPPGADWALPWHKDLTVAVRDNSRPGLAFSKPTRKEGVPHLEAPESVLAGLLTARVHLDPAGAENGALQVLPGSHLTGKRLVLAGQPILVEAEAGDVLLMRPLLVHASSRSHPDTTLHRRILHLEFAPDSPLPDGHAWHGYHALTPARGSPSSFRESPATG